LIIAGYGKDYDEVVAYVKSDKDIRVTGHVDGDDKIELFKSAHIYCLPSYSEGLPTSVLEAMAFGLPIITTAVGGLKDFFQEEKMGYFVDLKNEEELEHKLALLLSKKELITKIGKYNHTYAMENLIAPVVAKRLYDHFQNSMENTNTISS
jgi:glycosyltransferase involved in cell wall biosynthesis